MEIIVPVYNAAAALAVCLEALFTSLPEGQPVQIVDDASTDPEVRRIIARWREREGVDVHEQAVNRGFVATVNAAMSRARGDVILLNSDTRPTHGWLQRMQRCAESDPRIATVTPFSNNAEICSLPAFCRNNPPPDDPERVAAVIARTGAPRYPDLPTAVGFCMYIRRAALDELGDFDEARFGRGYGEENDFCRRAHARGWRNVLCDDAYVVHLGGASFSELGLAPGGENLARLLERYPDYNDVIADFIRTDPLKSRREELVAALQGAV